ncbi:MAG: glycosyltransferase, partial [Parvibaculaceae bacterium]
RQEKAAQSLLELGAGKFSAVSDEIRNAAAFFASLPPPLIAQLDHRGDAPISGLLSRLSASLATMADEHQAVLDAARQARDDLTDPEIRAAIASEPENPGLNPFRKKKSRRALPPRLERLRVALEALKPDKARSAVVEASAALEDFCGRLRVLLDDPSRSYARRGPKVSIVMPVYNHAHFIEEAIEGVLAQSYGNWELIIVDDGSRDDLAAAVAPFAQERRIILLRQENQTLPAALNNGFHFATGDFLTWTSADNVMLPDQIATLVKTLLDHSEAGLAYSDYWAIDDQGRPLEDWTWRPQNRDPEFDFLIRLPDEASIANFHDTPDNFIGASFLYRREIADIVGRYSENMFRGEDYDYWLRMHLAARFHHVAQPLYRYRVHDDTLTVRARSGALEATIARVSDEDKWRLDNILGERRLADDGEEGTRSISQFKPALLDRLRIIRLSEHAQLPWRLPDDPLLLDVDIPLRRLDPGIAAQADVLLCRDDLAVNLLKQAPWAHQARILRWDGTMSDAVRHAFVQSVAERAAGAHDCKPGPLPVLDPSFHPRSILFLVERWSTGGLEYVVADLARGMASRGIPVTIAAAEGPLPDDGFGADIETVAFDGDPDALARFLAARRIDLVSAHHTLFGIAEANRLRVPYVYTMHNSYLWFDAARLKQWSNGLAAASHVVAVSPQVAQFAAARLAVPPAKLSVIPNPIDLAAFDDPGPRPTGEGRPFTVLALGSFNRVKLQHVLVAAFEEAHAQYPDMRLSLIGAPFDQAYFEEVSRLVERSPARAAIEIIPGLPHGEALKRLSSAHVFSLASALEGWSVALMEAVASGCACIASEVGGVPILGAEQGSIITLPSPLGELESMESDAFHAALRTGLPEHRANLAAVLKRSREDYDILAARASASKERLAILCERDVILTDWLRRHVLAGRAAIFAD